MAADQKGWREGTAATLSETKALTSSVRSVLLQIQGGEVDVLGGLTQSCRPPANAAEVAAVDERIRELLAASKKARGAANALAHERRVKYGLLKLSEQRLGMRAKRPEKELFKDRLDEALANEQRVLTAAREELRTVEKELYKHESDLENVSACLVKEVAQMRKLPNGASGKLGKSVSLPALAKTPGGGNGGDATVPPSTPASPTGAAADPSLAGMSVRDLMKCAAQREDASERACKRGSEALLKAGDDCSRACARVVECLEQRTAELGELKTKLREQQEEADEAIVEMDRALKMMRRESEMCKPDAQKKVDTANEVFAQLKSSREKLAADLRSKSTALKIDQTCKNMAPHSVDLSRRRPKNGANSNFNTTKSSVDFERPVSSP